MQGLNNYDKEVRPWGSFERFTLNEASTVKVLVINPGEQLSLQTHAHRDEFWHVVKGSGQAQIGEAERQVAEGDSVFVPRGTLHRLTAGEAGLSVLEIAFGQFAETDEVRLADAYGRAA